MEQLVQLVPKEIRDQRATWEVWEIQALQALPDSLEFKDFKAPKELMDSRVLKELSVERVRPDKVAMQVPLVPMGSLARLVLLDRRVVLARQDLLVLLDLKDSLDLQDSKGKKAVKVLRVRLVPPEK